MILAFMIRFPACAGLSGKDLPDVFTDGKGLPYFNQMDAYYHLRMAEDIAEKGVFGELNEETGERTDPLRFSPEGTSASYHAGIVYAAVWIWRFLKRFFDADLQVIAFDLSCLFAALTAFAAFWFARRMSNTAGGLFAAVFVSCAPAFVRRTAAGSFDTDMVQLLFAILMMYLMAGTILSKSFRTAVLTGVGTAAAAAAFTLFWSASSLFFAAAMFAGGVAGLVFLDAMDAGAEKGRHRMQAAQPGLWGFMVSMILTGILLLVLHGPAYLGAFLGRVRTVSSSGGKLPDLFGTVSELQAVSFAPDRFADWFRGYVPGPETVVNGLGGFLILLLALPGLILPVCRYLKTRKEPAFLSDEEAPGTSGPVREAAVFAVISCVWFVFCLYGMKVGLRFVEHLAAPAGILAGSGVGWLTERSRRLRKPAAVLLMVLFLGAGTGAVCMTVTGAYRTCLQVTPVITDASCDAMDWIAGHANSERAVIASWWDAGYFYEYEARHPVLWDGGSQNARLALVISKALVTADMQQSKALIQMLAVSGNKPALLLTGILGMKTGFEALFACAALDSEETIRVLEDEYGMETLAAEEAEELLHPDEEREIYLVLNGRMLMRLGLIEYYAAWDFGEAQPLSESTAGSREQETFYRLYLERDGTDANGRCFEMVFEEGDGEDHVEVWRVL